MIRYRVYEVVCLCVESLVSRLNVMFLPIALLLLQP